MKVNGIKVTATEQTPLLKDVVEDAPPALVESNAGLETIPEGDDPGFKCTKKDKSGFLGVLSVLLIGVFIANADTSLVLATYGRISSEFNSLENASWLLTGYMLSMCATQPLYGKLSNIFGRKPLLLLSYVLFALGNFISGVANSMAVLVVGRVIGGAGGAGMSSVVSFLIADMVPIRELATYRSYANVVQTIGRSCGGPLGGKMAEVMGWRWSFLIQVPLTALAIGLVSLRLESPKLVFKGDEETSVLDRLKRIDFLGSFLMCAAIVAFLLPFSIGGNQVSWTHPVILILLVTSGVLTGTFAYVELKVAREPIFPLSLLTRRDVVLPYVILFLQNIAQTFMMFVVPLYFQITNGASLSAAGFYLVPAVLGNTVGGLMTGAYIKRHGRYKILSILAATVAGFCHALISVRWTGNTGTLESLYIFFGGVGTGIAHSSTFVAVTVGTTDEEFAIAGAGLYLSGGLGSVLGVTAASSALRLTFIKVAKETIGRDSKATQIIERALSDVGYVRNLTGHLREAVVGAYVWGFRVNFVLALLCCVFSLVFSIFLRERRIT